MRYRRFSTASILAEAYAEHCLDLQGWCRSCLCLGCRAAANARRYLEAVGVGFVPVDDGYSEASEGNAVPMAPGESSPAPGCPRTAADSSRWFRWRTGDVRHL